MTFGVAYRERFRSFYSAYAGLIISRGYGIGCVGFFVLVLGDFLIVRMVGKVKFFLATVECTFVPVLCFGSLPFRSGNVIVLLCGIAAHAEQYRRHRQA